MLTENMERLVSLYQKETIEYEKCLKIAQEIRVLIDGGEISQVNAYLEKKAKLISEIDRLDQEIFQLKKDAARLLGLPDITLRDLRETSIPEATRLKTVLQNLLQLLKKLEETEADNQRMLESRIEGVKKEFRQIQTGKTAHTAYNNKQRPVESRFVDKRR